MHSVTHLSFFLCWRINSWCPNWRITLLSLI